MSYLKLTNISLVLCNKIFTCRTYLALSRSVSLRKRVSFSYLTHLSSGACGIRIYCGISCERLKVQEFLFSGRSHVEMGFNIMPR